MSGEIHRDRQAGAARARVEAGQLTPKLELFAKINFLFLRKFEKFRVKK